MKELNKMEDIANRLDDEALLYKRISDTLECYHNTSMRCVDDSRKYDDVFKFNVGNDKYPLGEAGIRNINESFKEVIKIIGPEILKIMKFEFIRKEKLALLEASSIRLQIFSRIIPEVNDDNKRNEIE